MEKILCICGTLLCSSCKEGSFGKGHGGVNMVKGNDVMDIWVLKGIFLFP